MLSPNVQDNLRFLVREVQLQLERTQRYIAEPSPKLRKGLLSRDNYIDNLRTFIQRACFGGAVDSRDSAEREYLRAIDVVAVNLERIADFCEDIVGQLEHVAHREVLEAQDFSRFFDEVYRGLSHVEDAVLQRDVHVALSICRAEPRLDDLYGEAFRAGVQALRDGAAVETHATLLFIWHYFERMGDSLLNIGEAVISAALGERIKIGQLWALEDSISDMVPDQSLDSLEIHSMGESRSGCRIARVTDREAGDIDGKSVIFKEGAVDKLQEEKEGIERWQARMPDIPPRVYSFNVSGPHGALLLEYIPGRTFEDILLGQPREALVVLQRIGDMLRSVWTTTRSDDAVAAEFSEQLRKRLPDVYAVHPDFRGVHKGIGRIDVPSFQELVERASACEQATPPPFSVLTHGDFNIDNVIFDITSGRIRLIDLHRSRPFDYVQDVSVFMVSNFRMQIFEAPVRKRINRVILAFHSFAREFAQDMGDVTFGARLAFGLARSFATSTRFVLDEEFAKVLFLRSEYLLQRLVRCTPEQLQTFTVPDEVLID